jgi:hypothetical protein
MTTFDDQFLVSHGLAHSSSRDSEGSVVHADFTCGLLTDGAVEILSHRPDVANVLILNLSWCPISDAALLHLHRLSQLETLILDHTAISDEGIPALSRLSSLSYISLDHTQVTTIGLARVVMELPNIIVRT